MFSHSHLLSHCIQREIIPAFPEPAETVVLATCYRVLSNDMNIIDPLIRSFQGDYLMESTIKLGERKKDLFIKVLFSFSDSKNPLYDKITHLD